MNRGNARFQLGILLGTFLAFLVPLAAQTSNALKTRTVVLIVLDGVRWQEVFDGPEHALMDEKTGGVQNVEALRKQFWRDTPEDGRKALFPFLWEVVAKKGQIYGNRHKNSIAQVTNGLKFSYPGYNEMLTGRPDPRIDKNEFGPNPNVTVFEWLNTQLEFHDKLAVFATWNNFNEIFNGKRSGLFLRAGWDVPWPEPLTARQALLKKLYATSTRVEDDDVFDSFMQENLLDYLDTHQPRALFVGLGETDDWAHAGRYDLVLEAAHEADQRIADLWTKMQEISGHRDEVTFIITTDHGRGSGPTGWKNHDKNVPGAENIWIAALGPDTPPLGEISNSPRITQSQIAATVAALLGQDFRAANLAVAPALPVIH